MNNPVFKFFYAIWFITALTAGTIVLGLAALAASLFSARASRYVSDISWSYCVFIPAGIKLQTLGLENLPTSEGGLIIYANHTSAADIPAVGLSTGGRLVSWLAKASLGKIPFFGWALARAHMLVDRGGGPEAARKMVDDAKKRLADNQILAIFPEGTRNRTDELLLPFKKGAFILAKQTGAPVVPVAIKNAGRLWPAGAFCPRPGLIKVKIGAPLPPMPGEKLADLTQRAHTALKELLADESW